MSDDFFEDIFRFIKSFLCNEIIREEEHIDETEKFIKEDETDNQELVLEDFEEEIPDVCSEKHITTLELLNSSIGNSVLNKINELLEKAYVYDPTGLYSVECVVCYTSNTLIPLECKHHVCRICYTGWSEKGRTDCPLCRSRMITVEIHKKIVVLANLGENNIGLLYFPPIENPLTQTWKEYDLLDETSKRDMARFVKFCERINDENYAVVLVGIDPNFIKKSVSAEIKKLRILEI